MVRTQHQQRNQMQRRKLRTMFRTDVRHWRMQPYSKNPAQRQSLWRAVGAMYRSTVRQILKAAH